MGYNETSKSYRINVLGKKHIEVNRYVIFHEEATFHHSKELPYDIKEHGAPTSEHLGSQI